MLVCHSLCFLRNIRGDSDNHNEAKEKKLNKWIQPDPG
jgi:hypothetical protein